MGHIFDKQHITENAVGVPHNLLYLQEVFESYTLKQWSPILCNRGPVNAWQFYRCPGALTQVFP